MFNLNFNVSKTDTLFRPVQYSNCNETLQTEHFSINEQGIASNYVKKDILPAAIFFQNFHPHWSSTITPRCAPFQPIPRNNEILNFVATIHQRPETPEASTSSLRCNSYVPLPQLSDETLYLHLGNTDSEAGSSGTESDDVTLTTRKFTSDPAGQHLYELSSSNLHTPQYATFHYNSGSRKMSSVSPNRDTTTLYTTFKNKNSEASSSGTENGEVANTTVDNTLTEKNLTGGPGQQGNVKLKKKRVRTTYEGLQVVYLENMFRENKFPDRVRRINMAQKLKLSEKQIKIWFQNRRIKDKKEKLKTRNISSMNAVPQHKNENVGTAASFNLFNNSAPLQNQNMPIFQAPYEFQYMRPPLGLNVYGFQPNYQSQKNTGHR